MASNGWFAGFTEADGHFGVKIVESKPKSDIRKKSVSDNISLKFRLDQRSFDKPNQSSMLPIMERLADFLSCDVETYLIKPNFSEVYSVSVQSISKIGFIITYFNKYNLLAPRSLLRESWAAEPVIRR